MRLENNWEILEEEYKADCLNFKTEKNKNA